MKYAVLLVLAVLALAPECDAEELTEAQLREIVAKPHSPRLSVEELRIFPPGRAYCILLERVNKRGNSPDKSFRDCVSKWVDGKYIVWEESESGWMRKDVRVMTYDEKAGQYVEYFLLDEGIRAKSVGERIDDTRATTWKQNWIAPEHNMYDAITTFSNTDSATFWHRTYRSNGIPYYFEDGIATATKMDFEVAEVTGGEKSVEFQLIVNTGKAEDYLKSKFAVYRNGEKRRTLTPVKAQDGKLIFVVDGVKTPEDAILKTDNFFLEE